MRDKTDIDANMVAFDESTNIALFEVKTDQLSADKRTIPVLAWEVPNLTLRVGDWVLASGNPFGFGSTVTNGMFSNISR